MRKRYRMPEMKEGGVNVTPLIDVVMCLIIFFMLVAKIGVDTGADKSIVIPTSLIGVDLRQSGLGNTVTLNVMNGPTDVANAEPLVTTMLNGQLTELKLQELGNVLKMWRYGDPTHGLAANPDFRVIIRGDKSLTYNFLAPVLIQITQAHVKSFAFDTKVKT